MKHATLNVYEIKTSLNEYIIFKKKLNEQSEIIVICADIDFGMSFMNESLLLKDNLYEQLNIVSSITARDMFDEKIINKRMHLTIQLIDFKNVMLQTKSYVIKDIKVDLILNNDVLKTPQNKISLHLHNKKMQIKAIQVLLKFISSNAASISFNVNNIIRLKSCLKASAIFKSTATKTIKFKASN